MRHPATSLPFRQRGVTLAELAAVVVVLGFVASAAVLNGAASDLARAEAARSLLARAIRHARDESLRTREPHAVRVDTGSNRVRVFRVDTGVSPAGEIYDVRDPLTKKLWDYRIGDEETLAGVDISRTINWRAACARGAIIVFRDGATPSCLDPLTTLLENATFTASRGGQQAGVYVEGFVARVDLQ